MNVTATSGLSRPQLFGLGGASALIPLNSTMIAVALPLIAADFDISVGRTSLLVTTYLVAMLVAQPFAGRLGDRVGADRAIRWALVGFLGASVMGALAPTFGLLVAARMAQALTGATLVPSVQSLLRAVTVPEERGRIFGVHGSMLGAGAASGPFVGGGLIAVFGWQAIFWVNVPVVIVALGIVLPRLERRTPGPEVDDVAAAVTWRNPVFLAGFAVQALSTFGQYMLLLLTPVLLYARGWTSGWVGVALSALTVGMIVMGPVGGRFGDTAGRRAPVLLGLGVCALVLVAAALAGRNIDVWLLVVVLLGFGSGLGFAVPSITTASLESVDLSTTSTAAGILSMSRYVGSIVTSLVVGAWLSADGTGATRVLVLAAVTAVLAVAAATRLPNRPHEPVAMSARRAATRSAVRTLRTSTDRLRRGMR
ncbi:MFS transporter [soil metagenome]